jgi:hypothetical protein
MSVEYSFAPMGYYIATDLRTYTESLVELVNLSSQSNKVELASLIFCSQKPFDVKNVNLKVIIDCGIPIFDFIIYLNLSTEDKAKIIWKVNDKRRSYTESQISYSIMTLYFMLVTRNKTLPEKGEQLPIFLTKFMKNVITMDEIRDCLSLNNLNLFNHVWIKNVDISILSDPFKNRFKRGIAGMRLWTVIAENEPDKELNANMKKLISDIKLLVSNGPYWEMHTIFQSPKLASYSINACLQNIILEVFSDEKIDNFVESKMLFKKPIYNIRTQSYKGWDKDFYGEFKSKLIFNKIVKD